MSQGGVDWTAGTKVSVIAAESGAATLVKNGPFSV